MVEQVDRKPESNGYRQFPIPGQISLIVPGLFPALRDGNGNVIVKDNLPDKGADLIEGMIIDRKTEAIADLINAINSGDQKAVFTITSGTLHIFMAARGVKLNIKHGERIGRLMEILSEQPTLPSKLQEQL